MFDYCFLNYLDSVIVPETRLKNGCFLNYLESVMVWSNGGRAPYCPHWAVADERRTSCWCCGCIHVDDRARHRRLAVGCWRTLVCHLRRDGAWCCVVRKPVTHLPCTKCTPEEAEPSPVTHCSSHDGYLNCFHLRVTTSACVRSAR